MRGQHSSGELDYGDKALQESRLQSYSKHTKTDQVKDRYIHTLEKNFDHLTLCIGTTSPWKRKFFFCFIYLIIFYLIICTLVIICKYLLDLSFSVQTFFHLISLDSALSLLDLEACFATQKKNIPTLSPKNPIEYFTYTHTHTHTHALKIEWNCFLLFLFSFCFAW